METWLKRYAMTLVILLVLGLFAQMAQAGGIAVFGAGAIKQMGISGKQGVMELTPKEDYPGMVECGGVVYFDLAVPEGRAAYATALLARTLQSKTLLAQFGGTPCFVDNFYIQ